VRSKADIIQLIPHGTKLEKWKREKTKKQKRICSEVSVNSPGNPCGVSAEEEKGRYGVGFVSLNQRPWFPPSLAPFIST